MGKLFVTYNQIHKDLYEIIPDVKSKADPEVIIAIGGGGYIPARIVRTLLGVPTFGIGIQLYDPDDKIRPSGPQKIQWLDKNSLQLLKGKRVLLVDDVDDARTTLRFCVEELKKVGIDDISVLVLHNKQKEKKPLEISHYFACWIIPKDCWVVYPWESTEIDEHDKMSE